MPRPIVERGSWTVEKPSALGTHDPRSTIHDRPVNVATALCQATELLEKDGITAPRLTAEVLLAHALLCERVDLYAHPERELTQVEQVHYGRYLNERLKRKPTQYITGHQEFYGREFRVTPAVLIPRPETELVVAAALRHARGAARVLDVGTGSGCLAITLKKELPKAVVFGSEVSYAALELATENARRLDAAVEFFRADMLEACGSCAVDLIVCNPPYVSDDEMENLPPEVRDYEPALALQGGEYGVEFYRRFLGSAARSLRPGGWLVVELGHRSWPKIAPLVGGEWASCIVEPDLAGIERVMAVQKNPA